MKAIVAGTTNLAQAIATTVAVEALETEEQAEKLKETGCGLAQGYYFTKPLPEETISLTVNKHPWLSHNTIFSGRIRGFWPSVRGSTWL